MTALLDSGATGGIGLESARQLLVAGMHDELVKARPGS
jgi:hypothetical protein